MIGIYWLSGYYNNVFLKSRSQELGCTHFCPLLPAPASFCIGSDKQCRTPAHDNFISTPHICGGCFCHCLRRSLDYNGICASRGLFREMDAQHNDCRRWRCRRGYGIAPRDESQWSGMRILGCLSADDDFVHQVEVRRLDSLVVVMPHDGDATVAMDIICRIRLLGI